MVCTKISLAKIHSFIHCPQPGQSRDMDLCCGDPNRYPGQYCCNGLKSGLYSVGETIGILIGVFSAVIILACLVIMCCGFNPTPSETGNNLVIAPIADTSSNPPDIPLVQYSETSPTDAQD